MRIKMNDYVRSWDNENRKWIYFHRLIAEKMLGRKLDPFEQVHHKDGNILNNNVSNIEVTTKSNHMKTHSPVYKRKTNEAVFVIGSKVKIRGIIEFGMDFRQYKGEFGNKVFTIAGMLKTHTYDLKAKGYGDENDYGNGSIFVSDKYKDRFIKVD